MELSHEAVSACLGDAFAVPAGFGAQWVLTAVEDHQVVGEFESFVMEFTVAGAELAASQGMVALHHDRLGAIELFVVAAGPAVVCATVSRQISDAAS
jgi:hypothetical protein